VFAVRFLDKHGLEVMRVDSLSDLKPDKNDPRKFSHYLKAHPLTEWVEIVISNAAASGSVMVDDVGLSMADENAAATRTTVDLDQAMQPFWQGTTIYHEAVLMWSENGLPATGQLMFHPTKIISVQDYGLVTNYVEGTDYILAGRTLTRTASSRMTQVRAEELLKGELAWNYVGGKQVLVTYEHADAWTHPGPAFLGENLPGTMRKLKARAPLRIVAYGDSITHGVGASRLSHIPPWQPPWAELFAHRLEAVYHDSRIQLYNSAQSGADAYWAKTMAARMVTSLNPDLVMIAFGQNDFWSYPANDFSNHIASVIETVRAENPAAEFLLVSTMRFDPAYTANTNYWKVVGEYAAKLQSMTGTGVQLVDLTALTELLYAVKKPKDFLNDPLHPNDYLARWYAQSLEAALDPAAAANSPAPESSGKNVH
jgi:lysophospholipase L1-like esterase